MKRGAIVIYESTVYPGATEEVCVPILERHSKLRWRADFHIGYSPERINPGDREHTLARIVKIVSGDDAATLEQVAALYAGIVTAGVYKAPSIRVAEAAKVIENTQRDLNIALINELAIMFDQLGIDTHEVLQAAGTNGIFCRSGPGLVGGHCIGVDPYYLTYKAEKVGYHPQVILAGRRINDGMGQFIADKTLQQIAAAGARGQRRAGQRARPYLQGKRARPAQFQGRRCDCRAARCRRRSARARSARRCGGGAARIRSRTRGMGRAAAGRRADPRRAAPYYLEMPLAALTARLAAGGCVIDIKSALDRGELARAGVRVWRL